MIDVSRGCVFLEYMMRDDIRKNTQDRGGIGYDLTRT